MNRTLLLPRWPLVFVLTLGALPAGAVVLQDSERVNINVPPNDAVTDLQISVPAGTETMRVELSSGNGNLDLFVRKGAAFDAQAKGADIAEALRAQADYISFGPVANPDEFVIITNRMTPPLTSGTWYFAVSSLNAQNTSVGIEVNFNDVPTGSPAPLILVNADDPGEGFNDNGPWFGLGGNNAASLGEARWNAAQRAVDNLAERLDSPVPIVIVADWRDDVGESTLASAGPDYLFHGTQGLPLTDTWFAGPPAVRLGGTEACRLGDRDPCVSGTRGDISISINVQQDWYLGFDPDAKPGNQFDFIDVIMHEMMHGLGIITFMDRESGEFLNPFTFTFDGGGIPDIYAVNMESVLTGDFVDITAAQRSDAITSGNFLHFTGTFATASPRNIYAGQGDGHMLLHAPPGFQSGSSVSHVHQGFGVAEIMTPTVSASASAVRDPGIALPMLLDVGWAGAEALQETPLVLGMHYDRGRSGHGIDLQKVGEVYFLVFYTYEGGNKGVASAAPTWYLAVGTIEDGVFTTDANNLQRFTYDAVDDPPQTLDTDFEGDVSLTFGVDASHPNCDDGVNRNSALTLVAFDWSIGADSGSWCMEPLVIHQGAPPVNPTGHWFAGSSDQGWGMTVYFQGTAGSKVRTASAPSSRSGFGTSNEATPDTAKGAGNSLEFLVLYFYDADGLPRWALGVKEPSALTNTINMDSFTGFAPADPPVSVSTTPAGTISHDFLAAISAVMDIDVTHPGGGDWQRFSLPMEQLSDPAE